MVEITEVEKGSAAECAGLAAGDRILRINGNPVEDYIDFYYQAAEDFLELELEGTPLRRVGLEREPGTGLGLAVAEDSLRRCGNRCLFCFVDQLPRGLRPALYVKDEDYRQSFLRGNFITGSNLSADQVERIIRLGLSPLYISVHATDPAVRGRMLGGCRKPEILPLLRRLLDGGVRLHYQAVVCPGYNDGAVLERTVEELAALGEGGLSLALVPVGLTAHRQGLAELTPVKPVLAREVLDLVQRSQARFLRERGSRFVFAADEFYLIAGRAFPRAEAYEDYPQIENGVGLVRHALEGVGRALRRLARRGLAAGRIGLVSGTDFAPIIEKRVIPRLERRFGPRFSLARATNSLLGDRVTVAGLLPGR
ncbi:DUF512 domain-containing protein, partial [bacterium]|nr:DUF512 domain-containing protein [bacterium]